MSGAKDNVRAERVHYAINEDYRRMEYGEKLLPIKTFVATGTISTVVNDLHKMLRWLQIERYKLV